MELLPLVCFCLLICSGTTFGDEVIEMRVNEDEDVILPCSLDSTNIRTETFDWKKDDQKEVFLYSSGNHYNNGRGGQDPQFKGRVFHFEDQLQSGNASIVIRKSTYKDSGNYSCSFPYHQPEIRSTIELIVVIRVKEDEDVILPCSLDSTNIRSETFDWKKDDQKKVFLYSSSSHPNNGRPGQDPQFKGRVFHFEDQLQSGNASIVIRNTTYKDSGNYSCIFPFHQPMIRSTIELIVDCILKDRTDEKIAGSCPKPSVTNLHPTKDWALLQCEVQIQDGFPKPKVEWFDSENNRVPVTNTTEGKYIILKANVTKTGYYRCVSTQEEICHQTYSETHVNLNDKDPGSSTGLIVGVIVLSVVLVIVLAVGAVLYFKRKSRNGTVYRLINRCLQCLRRQNDTVTVVYEDPIVMDSNGS